MKEITRTSDERNYWSAEKYVIHDRRKDASVLVGLPNLSDQYSAFYENLPSLPPSIIRECLVLYPSSHVHLCDFGYGSGVLNATVLPHEIDYSTITVNYYTATQIVMITSQMAYVLGGCVMHDPEIKSLGLELYPFYLDLLNKGQLYYARMNIRLRKKTSNKSSTQVKMKVQRILRRNNLYLMLSRMDFGLGNSIVDTILVMDDRRFSQ